jgi:hypothetical protein
MKAILATVAVLLSASFTAAQSAEQTPKGCLIVKHKGTVGRRLLFTALIGLPIAPGAKYDLVEASHMPAPKMSYKGKELEELQATGVRVIVLETKYRPEDLVAARQACQDAKPAAK